MTEELHPGLGSGALREALIKLSNEASGMLGLSGVRDAIGNTNMACLQLRVDEARALLSLSSPIEPQRTPGEGTWLDEIMLVLVKLPGSRDKLRTILRAYRANLLAQPTPQASSEIREALQRIHNLVGRPGFTRDTLQEIDEICEQALAPSRHEPLLELDGKPIGGLKRCKNCGLSETYWERFPVCESKSMAMRIAKQVQP